VASLLVDTHILLWSRTEPETLTAGERRALDSAQRRYVSCVTLWEFGILIGLGRIEANMRLLDVPEGYDLLQITPAHCGAYAELPLHHRDPFDRMLVAQARVEGLSIVSADPALAQYGVDVIW